MLFCRRGLGVSLACIALSQCCVSTVLSAETGKEKQELSMDLERVLEAALKNNKQILAGERELMAVHEEHVKALVPFRPEVGVKAQYENGSGKDWGSAQNLTVRRNSSVRSAGMNIRQNIFKGGSDAASLKEVDMTIQAKWHEFESLKQKVLLKVSSIYFEVIAKQEEIRNLDSLLISRQSSLSVATEMHSSGAAKFVDVLQARAAVAETSATKAKAQAEYEELKAQFEELTCLKSPKSLKEPKGLLDENMKIDQIEQIAFKNNQDVIAAQNKLQAQKASAKKPSIVPSVDVFYNFNQSADSASKVKEGQYASSFRDGAHHSVGVSVSIPVYDGGLGRAQRRQATENVAKAAIEKENAIASVRTSIIAAFASRDAAKQSITSANIAIEARALAVHDVEEEYKSGSKIISELHDAEKDLYQARLMLVKAKMEYFIAQCHLLSLMGRMNAKFMKLAAKEFNYSEHFAITKNKI